MNNSEIISTVQEQLTTLLADNPAHFLVDVRIKPTNNIKVFIDGDAGVGIDELVRYNRRLYKALEEMALFPEGDFSLEVSSPGLDEPLKMHRQYVKNIGRDLDIVLLDDSAFSAQLLEVTEGVLKLSETRGKGKKQEIIAHELPVENIKSAKVAIKF